MATEVHYIDCGQGNMVLIDAANGKTFLCDCNVTEDNEDRVIAYLKHVLRGRRISVFICTHRDADHMRGINRVHRAVGIDAVWDCGLPGGNPSSPEGEEYMRMRRAVPNAVLRGGTTGTYAATRLHVLSAADDGLPDDCNAQSIVLKVEQIGNPRGTAILTGDSDVRTWKRILERYRYTDTLSSEILLGSHHGSWSFFDINRHGYHYPDHMRAISPAMTILSVGPNVHDHPHPQAVLQYEYYSRGSRAGARVWRTDHHGTMRLDLHERDGWTLSPNQDVYVPMLPPPPPPPQPYYAGQTIADLVVGWDRPSLPPPPSASLFAELLADLRPAPSFSGFGGPPEPPPALSLSGFGRPPSATVQARALRESGSSPLVEALLRHNPYRG
jgi:competence protein ComEC